MTIVLTKASIYGQEASEPRFKRYLQKCILSITAANTDATIDLGNDSGTFWTAVLAQVTGLPLASVAAVQQALKDIVTRAETPGSVVDVESIELLKRSNAGGAGVMTLAGTVAAGSATPTAVVTGLVTTDTVLSVVQHAANANSLPLLGYGTVASNALPLVYSADPGAGGTITVAVARAGATLISGEYSIALQNGRPNITFVSGNAPTAYDLVLTWVLQDAAEPVELYEGLGSLGL